MALETFTLDGLALNTEAGTYMLTALSAPPPRKRPEWAEATDGDGGLLVRDPHFENRQIDATVEVMAASRDAAHTAVGAITDKLQEASKHPLGIPLVWTPADSTKSTTWYVLMGEIGEIPITHESGYFASPPVLAVPLSLTCRPFGYGAERGALTDDFSTDTIGSGNYTFDLGAGTLSVSGGQLVPSSTAEKRLWHSARGYRSSDVEVTLKVVTGASVTGLQVELGKRLDANNQILLLHGGPSVYIFKRDGGTLTQLGANGGGALAASTPYWMRFRIEGNKVTSEVFTAAPGPASTPVGTTSYTLTGAEATKFGAGVSGDVYMGLIPGGTDWRFDDFSATVNVYKGTGPLLVAGPVYGVEGDVPAEASLVVTDTAGLSRDLAVWGLEWRHQAGADLELRQNELTNTGFAGVSTTRAGSVSTNVYRGTLTTSPVAVCGTGNQPHVGTWRPYLRCYPSSTSIRVRFTYREGDGPLKSLEWEMPVAANAWNELDLGVVTVPPRLLGTQRWQGQVEAYSSVVGDTLDVDYLLLVPAGEGYGRARRIIAFGTSTTFSARDEFDQAAGALTGKTAPVGGVWAGAGDADDFAVETAGKTAQRTAVSDTGPRFDYLPVALTGTVVQADVKLSALVAGAVGGVVARYVSTTDNLRAWVGLSDGVPAVVLTNGAFALLGRATLLSLSLTEWVTVRLVVSGNRAYVWVFPKGGAASAPVIQRDVTGFVSASGNPGLADNQAGAAACTRSYDNFLAFAPVADAVCFANQSIEFRSDDTVREDSSGVYYGRPREYRGAPFFLPPAGDENRASRIPVMLRRNDIYTTSEANVTDAQQVEVRYVPRYLYLPR